MAVARGVQAEPPGLDIDSMIPEAGLSGGDCDLRRADDVEVCKLVVGGGVSYVDAAAVDGDSEEVRAHLVGDGRGIKARGGVQ